jgi:hypothetical protein
MWNEEVKWYGQSLAAGDRAAKDADATVRMVFYPTTPGMLLVLVLILSAVGLFILRSIRRWRGSVLARMRALQNVSKLV